MNTYIHAYLHRFTSARKLRHHAMSAIREGKKALAIASEFLTADGNLPAGATAANLMNHVLDEMWKKDYTVKNKIDPTEAAGAPSQIPSRPDRWVFNGYLAYAYFGCPVLVPSEKRLEVYTINEEVDFKDKEEVTVKDEVNFKEKVNFKEEMHSSFLRQQQISSLQSENQHETKTLHAAKILVHNQLLSNLKFQKHAMEMVQFYRGLGDNAAAEEAIQEVREYSREKKALKLKALQLETRDAEEVKVSTKRKNLLNALLTEQLTSQDDRVVRQKKSRP